MEARALNITNRFLQHDHLESIESDAIGVLLYGHLRTFLYTMPPTLQSLAKFGELHLYIHTWDTVDSVNDAASTLVNIPQLVHSVCAKARVVSLQVDRQPHKDQRNDPRLVSPNTLAYMYYSMLMANSLKKNQENRLLRRYLRCIKLRPDIQMELCLEQLDSNIDYFFADEDLQHVDICAITSSQTMDRVCSFIGRVDCSQSFDQLRRAYRHYLSEELGMKRAPLAYGKDWWILRSSTFKSD
jgi:hypothetical protein